jgi:hypothetical protein
MVSATTAGAQAPRAATLGHVPAAARGPAPPSQSDSYVRNVLIAGAAKNVLDVGRAAVKLPEAYRAGRLMPALAQAVTASPTTHLIDPNAPRVASAASAGRSFTAVDAVGYRAASMLGVGLGAFQMANGIPNIVHAVHDGGPKAIVTTRDGRTGALQAIGGGITLGTFGRAAGMARASGVPGVGPVLLAAAGSASLASPWVLGATVATSGLVFANGRGFLDFMNEGETRTVRQVERDSWNALGVPDKVAYAKERTLAAAHHVPVDVAAQAREAHQRMANWADRVR